MVKRERFGTPFVFVKNEKMMMWTGILGVLLSFICLVIILIRGSITPPEGDLFRAVSFDLAVGIFVITTAVFFPISTFSSRSRSIFRWTLLVLVLYSYSIETIQHFRGIDPRFSTSAGPIDAIFGLVFGLVSLGLIICYVILSINFFRRKTKIKRPLLVNGIRYGMLSTMLAFVGGIWMIALQGRHFGDNGNVIWIHGLAFHGLQIIPLIALLTERAVLSDRLKSRFVHISGIAWLSALLMIGVQTIYGKSIFQISIASVLGLCLLVLVGVMFLILLRNVIKNKQVYVYDSKQEYIE